MYKVKMRTLQGKDTIYKPGWVNLKTFYKGRTNQFCHSKLAVAKYAGWVTGMKKCFFFDLLDPPRPV